MKSARILSSPFSNAAEEREWGDPNSFRSQYGAVRSNSDGRRVDPPPNQMGVTEDSLTTK